MKNRKLAQISESLGIPLSSKEAFNCQLSDRVGDFGLRFVVDSLNDIDSSQKITIFENDIYFGTINFMKCTDLHHALFKSEVKVGNPSRK